MVAYCDFLAVGGQNVVVIAAVSKIGIDFNGALRIVGGYFVKFAAAVID